MDVRGYAIGRELRDADDLDLRFNERGALGADWQNKLDQIRALGYGYDITWDDVMAMGIWAGLDWADYIRFMPTQNKACDVGELGYITDTGSVIQTFNVTTSFATDSTRIITSFPSGSTC